jgi:hypothetical protein
MLSHEVLDSRHTMKIVADNASHRREFAFTTSTKDSIHLTIGVS